MITKQIVNVHTESRNNIGFECRNCEFDYIPFDVLYSLHVAVRVNDSQLVMLSEKANYDHSLSGYLHKRTADSTKWQLRWFVLYQVNDILYHFYVN